MTFTYSEQLYSDLHKDARGYRPTQTGWEFWNSLAPISKQSHWDSLVAELEAKEAAIEKQQKLAAEAFEKQIEDLIKLGAKDRNAAISIFVHMRDDKDWIYDDMDYLCHMLHMRYGYFKDVELTKVD